MLSEVRLISFFIVLVLAAVSDIRKREIPDGIPLLVTIVSLIPLESVQLSGLLVALPLLMIGVTAGGIGGGDIKLTGACGLVLGFGRTLIGLITGLLLLLVFHAARQCVKRIKKAAIPIHIRFLVSRKIGDVLERCLIIICYSFLNWQLHLETNQRLI